MIKRTAFLIDDDRPTNIYNEIMVEESGVFSSWKIFDSAIAALEALKTQEAPDIIFLDINMPLMSGWDFMDAYEAAEIESKCECVVILTTSLSKYDLEKNEKYNRIKAFKEKPLSVEKLKSIVELIPDK